MVAEGSYVSTEDCYGGNINEGRELRAIIMNRGITR